MSRSAISALVIGLGFVVAPSDLLAHTGQPLAPHDLWHAWTFEPAVIALLVISAGVYARGVVRMWAVSETGRGIEAWRPVAFASGWVALFVALVSPLHALGSALFSAHMTQHEILISIAAPLLVVGRPLVPMVWAFPRGARRSLARSTLRSDARRAWNVLTMPSVAFALHAIALWTWHLPGLYQATLTNDLLHSLQHTSFIFTALLFWWTILGANRGQLARGKAILCLFLTALQTGALGALLTFAPSLWYPAYAATTGPWGLSPLDDQQLGGLIMWIPGSIAYLVAALVLFAEWLRDSEKQSRHRERAVLTARNVAALLFVVVVAGCDRASGDQRHILVDADVDRGSAAISKYGCGSCHTIPGIKGAQGLVGPPLGQVASRVYIAGVLPNEPDNMIRWLENPPAIDPKTAMPNMGVTARDARDIAAYLYTLR
ncbi:MAG TPA: cytochrome c oxidase assembly protein [Gemmatimonadaceae bacterium]|jgi:cytochrome c oxidase assembly factor CtaG/cytochrome c2|nr:cytochrome c oxidase assembly protein [Gemmatimonadaceae bacterium]